MPDRLLQRGPLRLIAASLLVWLAAAACYLGFRTPVFESALLLETTVGDSRERETFLRTTAEKLRRHSLYRTALENHDGAFESPARFRKATSIRIPPLTSLIEIRVRHPEKETAARLAEALHGVHRDRETALRRTGESVSLERKIAELDARRAELLERNGGDESNPFVQTLDEELGQIRSRLARQFPFPLRVADPVHVTGPVNPPVLLVLAAALVCGLGTGIVAGWIRSA